MVQVYNIVEEQQHPSIITTNVLPLATAIPMATATLGGTITDEGIPNVPVAISEPYKEQEQQSPLLDASSSSLGGRVRGGADESEADKERGE